MNEGGLRASVRACLAAVLALGPGAAWCAAALAMVRDGPAGGEAATSDAVGAREPGEAPDAAALARVLAEAVAPIAGSNPVERRTMLRQLRALRDPALEPLFAQLSASGDDGLRVQGVLGAAECSPAGLSLLMLRRVEQPGLRRALVAEAVRGGLLDRAALESLVRWPDVEGELLLEVAVALLDQSGAAAGEAVPRDRVAACARSEDPGVALTGALVHSWLWPGAAIDDSGEPLRPEDVLAKRGRELASLPRDRAAALLELVRSRRGVGAAGLVDAAGRGPALSGPGAEGGELLLELARTRVVCWPSASETAAAVEAVRRWAEAPERGAGTALAARVRLAMAVVESAAADGPEGGKGRLPDSVLAPLLADERPLVAKLARAAQACDIGCGSLEDRVLACLDELHPASAEAVLRLAAGRGPGVLASARARVLEKLDAPEGAGSAQWFGLAQRQSGLMAREAPADYREQLRAAVAAGSSRRVVAMVLGLLESGGPGGWGPEGLLAAVSPAALTAAGTIAGRERDVIEGVRDLALVTVVDVVGQDGAVGPAPAGGGAAQRAELARRLQRLALGQGSLPMAMRVRAAWVALRLIGEDRAGLARVLAGVETP